MAKYEVTTDLIVHTRVVVTVEADSKEDAINAASDLLPNNFDREQAKKWKAKVDLKAPKGIEIRVAKAYHFEQASGADKAKKVA